MFSVFLAAACCLTPATVPAASAAPVDTPPTRKPRVAPPQVAFQVGLMPLASTGVSAFRLAHPSYAGRGGLIPVLDGGVDPLVPGLPTASMGEVRVLDGGDFGGETDVALSRVDVGSDGCAGIPAGPLLCGANTLVQSADAGQPIYGGVLRELPLGNPPFADLN